MDTPPRFTMRQFWSDAADEFLSVDRGMPWTLWRLWRAPGAVIGAYLERRDPRVSKPLRLALVQLALAALLLRASGSDGEFGAALVAGASAGAGDGGDAADAARAARGVAWLVEHGDLVVLCAMVPALAAASDFAFRAARRDIAEHWVAALFVFAQLVLPVTALLVLDARIGGPVVASGLVALPLVLAARANLQLFGPAVRRPFPRAVLAAVLMPVLLLLALVAATFAAMTIAGR